MGYFHKSYNASESEFYLFVTSQITQLFKVGSTENDMKDIRLVNRQSVYDIYLGAVSTQKQFIKKVL